MRNFTSSTIWSSVRKMWQSSCANCRTRVRPESAPVTSFRCSTSKVTYRSGSSR